MANSRFEYVKQFERENFLLPDTYIVIRVDGKGFHKFSEKYEFEKPNDERALKVMNQAALKMMESFPDITVTYGDSDEYSFLLQKKCNLFERREMKLVSTFASHMSVYYMYAWNKEFPQKPLDPSRLPTFDARAVQYPTFRHVRDYFSWRQVDCHINNLYNTTFWNLVIRGGLTGKEAENRLIGTVSSDKNEILFKEFGINYNNEPEIYKKGTVMVRDYVSSREEQELSERQLQRLEKQRRKANISTLHVDIIKDDFWNERPWLE
ncbi:Piso0_004859 [Millerozyma farinosa CBS 7064]|uniref:tRNA(His) guanylyltransferase n=1 Tax=Pichia sorbitophila (strain ATCC MYA-4447 / BCRC 22081 / CBS 7064 / NBRC 10061 / NRRL Y-12695) TaxID=559304 RepID=G8Y3K8_PICSO|nr:Piso0_004859 [Millerozyma farinosa CBS 7064]